jgi:hypothetical protein
MTDLGDRLRFVRLLCGILRDTLSLDPLGFRVLLVVRAKQVNLIIVFLGSSSSSSSGRRRGRSKCLAGLRRAGKRTELAFVRLDVSIPARSVRDCCNVRRP